MNIVVLDGYTLNPGDLSWSDLEKLGNCVIHDRTAAEDILTRAKEAEILIINKVGIGKSEIARLPKLKYIGLCSTGYNVVDIQAAADRNIVVTNVPAYSTLSVAQMTFAHILNLCQHVSEHSVSVKSGEWSQSPDFCYWKFPLVELQDLTLGVIGFGRIGQGVADIGRSFGMNINYYDIAVPLDHSAAFDKVSLETLLRTSDVVTLHCPLTPATEQMINRERLSLMKSTAFLINTSRGQLIDEAALAEALNSGKLAGAGLDVLSTEPPAAHNPLLSARNCYITPHIAWATKAARIRLMKTVVQNVRAFLDGKPVNQVH